MSSLKIFFEDLGINLYEFKENDYYLVSLEELDKKVIDSKNGFPLLTSENCRHGVILGGEMHPVFETKEKIYLMKEITFSNGEFLVDCRVADMDDEDNAHPKVISIENLRKEFLK